MTKKNTKVKTPPREKIKVGPTSPNQALLFKRAQEVDFIIAGGSRGKPLI